MGPSRIPLPANKLDICERIRWSVLAEPDLAVKLRMAVPTGRFLRWQGWELHR